MRRSSITNVIDESQSLFDNDAKVAEVVTALMDI